MSVAHATMATAVSENVQAGLPKNMVPDPRWFDGDQSKFKDWWRGIRLFLKSNRVNRMDDRITAILARLRGGVAEIYVQKKLNELDKDNVTQDWDEFVKETRQHSATSPRQRMPNGRSRHSSKEKGTWPTS